MKICSIEGCGKPHKAKGFCDTHYTRPILKCSILGCEKNRLAKGLCPMHYARLSIHGSPGYTRPVYLDGLKVCSKCKMPKDPECFFRHAGTKDGLHSSCKPCNKGHPDTRRKHTLSQVGLTIEDYDGWLAAQGGVCAICKQPEPHTNKRLSVDHDHRTGKARGLLCSFCNPGLGMFRDSIATLSAAIEYLKRTGSYSGLE